MEFPAQLSFLRPMLQLILVKASQAGVDPDRAGQIELACEEALVNIIHYAYGGRKGMITLEFPHSQQFEVVIRDEGGPFNPLHYPSKDDHGEPGGWGLHLMQQCVDQVAYHRVGQSNELTLVINKHVTSR